ncbi:MAG: FkbM family methyltransferase [Alkalispirochaeta sp.]
MNHIYGILRSLVIYYLRPGLSRRLVEHYREFVSPGSVVFDIGAHLGNRTRAFSRLGATTIAFEPQQRPVAFLERLFRTDPLVTVDRRAAGDRDGVVRLYVCPVNPTIATTSDEWAREVPRLPGWNRFSFSEVEEVPMARLDTLIDEYGEPAFIKIDVEGAEAEVLAGLSRPVRALSFEFLPADRDVAFHSVLRLEHLARERGGAYRYNFSLGEELRLVMTHRWWTADELRDYLGEFPPDGPSGDIYARYEDNLQEGGRFRQSVSADVPADV